MTLYNKKVEGIRQRHQQTKDWCLNENKYVKTVTNMLRSEGLGKYQARRISLLNKSHLEACKQFTADMLKKEDSYFDKILWSDETKLNYLTIITITRFDVNQALQRTPCNQRNGKLSEVL